VEPDQPAIGTIGQLVAWIDTEDSGPGGVLVIVQPLETAGAGDVEPGVVVESQFGEFF
jgi:hypothetical protein